MAIPDALEVRDFLEGYDITVEILSDIWINNRINKNIVPSIERLIKTKIDSVETYEEYLSGAGSAVLILSKRPILEVTNIAYVYGGDYTGQIGLSSVIVLNKEGIVKCVANWAEGSYTSIFRKGSKNIKVVYTAGNTEAPDDLCEAILYLTSEMILGFVGARTGGGSLSVQGFSRNYGERGKYQDIRNDLKRQGFNLLKPYRTGIINK